MGPCPPCCYERDQCECGKGLLVIVREQGRLCLGIRRVLLQEFVEDELNELFRQPNHGRKRQRGTWDVPKLNMHRHRIARPSGLGFVLPNSRFQRKGVLAPWV